MQPNGYQQQQQGQQLQPSQLQHQQMMGGGAVGQPLPAGLQAPPPQLHQMYQQAQPGPSHGMPQPQPPPTLQQQQQQTPPTTNNGAMPKKTAKVKASGTGAKGDKAAKDKKTRSRLACLACKSTKQKCDGPSRVPCRRCELYGLECKFPPSAGVIVPTHPPAAPNAKPPPGEPSPAVTQKLYEIAARLQSIESALHLNPAGFQDSPHGASSHTASHQARSLSGSEDEDMEQDGEDKARIATYNPLHQITMSIDAIVGQSPRGAPLVDDYGAPDVLKRGVLTAEECQELFDFFFCSIHPWVMMLSLDEDRNAMGVRSRSSLLFHTILVLSTSYSTPFPSQLHTTLVTFTNNIFAPQILNPQPHELTTDFLRALDLLNLFKMTQFATRRAEGLDVAEAMRASKVNGLASWMAQGILARTAERLELSSVLSKFSRAYSASANGTPISSDLLKDLRLYYWLLSNDVHGNVQSGRRCNMEGAAALTTTRLFSSLQLQPYDTRLAASVEMFEVARPILRSTSYERTRRIARPDLDRYNQGMSAWEEFWIPVLQRQLAVDPLAMSVLSPFAWFITLQFNAAAYVSWKRNRFYTTDSDGGKEGGSGGAGSTGMPAADVKPKKLRIEGMRGLTQWEYDGLLKCVKAAEGLIFTLSEESRIPGGWRAVQWEEAERSDGWRKLIMDDSVVELSKWGMDAITCVAYIFPLVFLCKLVNEGLLTADLVLLQTPQVQQPWLYTQKLPRLLELGASFLDAIALNPDHPARSQAQVLRTLLDSGVKGCPPTSPQLPRHAATVMSPAPAPTAALFPPPPAGNNPGGPTLEQQQQQWQANNMNNNSGNNVGGASPALLQFQQQQQQGLGTGGEAALGRRGSLGGGMDQALTSVLDGFDPMFGESEGAFWEWGNLGAPGTGEVDWSAQPFR